MMKKEELKLSDVSVKAESIIKRKLQYVGFCRLIVILILLFDKQDYVHTTDIKKYLHVCIHEARRKLEELVDLGLLKRKTIGSTFIEYHPVMNGEKRVIEQYFKQAGEKLRKEKE